MDSQQFFFKCLICGKIINKENKYIHEVKCKENNNTHEHKNKENKNKHDSHHQKEKKLHKKHRKKSVDAYDYYKCEICGAKMNIREMEDHLLCHELEKEYQNNKNINERERNHLDVSFCDINIINDNNRNNIINDNNGTVYNASKYDTTRYIFNRFNNIQSVFTFNYENNRANRIHGRRSSMDYGNRRNNNFDDIFNNDEESFSLEKSSTGLDDKIIQNYPESKIKNPINLSEDKKKCLICLENFKAGDKSIVLPCTHLFHSKCIKCWMKKKNSCPLCKNKIQSKK